MDERDAAATGPSDGDDRSPGEGTAWERRMCVPGNAQGRKLNAFAVSSGGCMLPPFPRR